MSGISSVEPMSEYAPTREEKWNEVEPVKEEPREGVQAQHVQAAAQQQDEKTTTQGFQYTGKGSFIDKVF